jgi:hypothetical protein
VVVALRALRRTQHNLHADVKERRFFFVCGGELELFLVGCLLGADGGSDRT